MPGCSLTQLPMCTVRPMGPMGSRGHGEHWCAVARDSKSKLQPALPPKLLHAHESQRVLDPDVNVSRAKGGVKKMPLCLPPSVNGWPTWPSMAVHSAALFSVSSVCCLINT